MYEKQVAAGMDFLDNYYGNKSWVFDIDPGVLDLKSGCNCILGQLQGDYDTMLEILDLDEEDANDLGFCITMQPAEYNPVNWHKLTGDWLVAIKDRLDQGIEL